MEKSEPVFRNFLVSEQFSICWGHHTQFSPQAQENMRDFISSLSARYSFDRSYLEKIFTKVRLQQKALSLIKPSKTDKSQTITWDHYRKLFVNKDNIDKGKRFISTHIVSLEKAQKIMEFLRRSLQQLLVLKLNMVRIKENFLFSIHSQP